MYSIATFNIFESQRSRVNLSFSRKYSIAQFVLGRVRVVNDYADTIFLAFGNPQFSNVKIVGIVNVKQKQVIYFAGEAFKIYRRCPRSHCPVSAWSLILRSPCRHRNIESTWMKDKYFKLSVHNVGSPMTSNSCMHIHTFTNNTKQICFPFPFLDDSFCKGSL